MLRYINELDNLEFSGKKIRVAVLGCGLMGRSLIAQLLRVRGMRPSFTVDRCPERCISALSSNGVNPRDIISVSRRMPLIKSYQFEVSQDIILAIESDETDIVVDATGDSFAGAEIANACLKYGKHLVSFNVETESVVGGALSKAFREKGLIYTGIAGDEPGAMMDLFYFAKLLGFEVVMLGKGKNNPLEVEATPDSVHERAVASRLKPLRLTSFVDGTNTMIELAAISNATGFTPDIAGCHAPTCTPKTLAHQFSLSKDGGLLSRNGIVDFAFGVDPGVFAVIKTDSADINFEMQFLKMGTGPNYALYRPFHLTSLETPISIARAFFDHLPTIAPKEERLFSEVVALAKKNIAAGETLDGIGGFSAYGQLMTFEEAKQKNAVPIGLLNNKARAVRNIKKGEIITFYHVRLDTENQLFRMREAYSPVDPYRPST